MTNIITAVMSNVFFYACTHVLCVVQKMEFFDDFVGP